MIQKRVSSTLLSPHLNIIHPNPTNLQTFLDPQEKMITNLLRKLKADTKVFLFLFLVRCSISFFQPQFLKVKIYLKALKENQLRDIQIVEIVRLIISLKILQSVKVEVKFRVRKESSFLRKKDCSSLNSTLY